MSHITKRMGSRLAVLITTAVMVPLMSATPAHADLDRVYCRASWHSSWGYCTDNSVHSWDYNRIQTDSAGYLCERLVTSAGNVRAGGGCYFGAWTTLLKHQYSGGSPLTYAQCGLASGVGWRFIDCLASTP